MTRTVTEAGLTFTDPAAYADEDRLHEAFALLRREAPVHWVEAPGIGRSGLSPGTPTSWRSSGTMRCSSTRRDRCWRPR